MKFSDNLKKLRKDMNLSQEDLADKLGVSRQSISKWESGVVYPEMDKMVQLCKIFNLSMDDLLNSDVHEVNNSKQAGSAQTLILIYTAILVVMVISVSLVIMKSLGI